MKNLIREKRIKKIGLIILALAVSLSFVLHFSIESKEKITENQKVIELAENAENKNFKKAETKKSGENMEKAEIAKSNENMVDAEKQNDKGNKESDSKKKEVLPASEIQVSKISAPNNMQEPVKDYVTIEIRCDNIIANPRRITNEGIKEYIPGDGIILEETKVECIEEATVFDVIKDICAANDIAIDFEYSARYNSAYIKAIGFIYEKDVGQSSGWMYSVNGTIPNVGCSQYKVSKGDRILFYYSC